ncbi:MAG: acyloxyacyl hydrolase [Desulfobacterales bacterium]
MHNSIKSVAIWLVLSVLAVPPASAEDIYRIAVGVGHGPQWIESPIQQRNSVIDVNFFFKEYPIPILGRSSLLLGVGYSYLWTDASINRDNHVISLIPAYRYYFEISEKIKMFVHLAAGPSVMSSYNLGYQEQGSKFIFNDYAGFGVRFGQHNEWELSFVWRHLSNADLYKPNNGVDVPFTFSLGRGF